MNLKEGPTTEEIQDHLAVSEAASEEPGFASGLLAFGTMVRELPGVVIESKDELLRVELNQGGRVRCGVISIVPGGSGKIRVLDLWEGKAGDEADVDRIRWVYDRMAETYEQLVAHQAHYWDRARAWLKAMSRDGFTILDVGVGRATSSPTSQPR